MATANPSSAFTDGWSWFVAQNVYDGIIRELVESLDLVHVDIGNDLDSLIVYQLIKSDLMKELVCFTCALIDTSSARKQQIDLSYGAEEILVSMIAQDRFSDYSIVGELRALHSSGVRARTRSWLAFQHRKYVRSRTTPGSGSGTVALNLNPLGRQLAPVHERRIRFLMPDLLAARPRGISVPQQITDLADNVVDRVRTLLLKHDTLSSENAVAYLRRSVHSHFKNAWKDFSMKSQVTGVGAGTTLLTGTGGNYPARVISHQFWKDGATVVRTSHGGDVPMFHDFVVPTIEIPFSSIFVVFGDEAASAYRKQIFSRHEAVLPMYPERIEAVGSAAHRSIWQRFSKPPIVKRPKRITVVSASFLGAVRAVPHKKVHDIVYFEWHRRLLAMLSAAGYSVLSKRHPKGLIAGRKIFGDIVSDESILEPISAVEDRTDVYVIDTPGSALLDVLCTKKQVVLIDFPVKIMTDAARTLLNSAAMIVKANFDERNRIVVDMKELDDAIHAPVDIAAREQIVRDYILRPSPGISAVQKRLGAYG